ncbi:MAG: phage terminase GpA [bacterium]|nr:MAG: phage terminase GpA [bacterium]KAF0147930.1 MAG: phage terminase GpA [bacterium]KAF0168112.1 MAG: phage terminase GpA [bacterium]TXT22571.1 MAG: phage terminase GpA [bacterium]
MGLALPPGATWAADALDALEGRSRTAASLDALLARVWAELAPPPKMSIDAWAEKYRVLSPEESATPGRYSMAYTPALRPILQACSDPDIRKVVVMKSAQIGYTVGVLCNVMGYHVHHRPSVQVVVFPREKSAKDYAAEKFDPMVRATAPLAERISLKSRAAGNSATRKHYPGGLIKLVGSNSPSDVKSTSARIVAIEEPDDASSNVAGAQGDSIKLAEERAKAYPDHLVLIGGTPTAKGASSIEAEILASDQRKYLVPCPHCGQEHVPAWDNVVIPEDASQPAREIYGEARWEQAYYTCPACKAPWTEEERHAAIHQGHFEATAPATGAVGFLLNELLSTFPGSRVPVLARKYLEAKHKQDEGDNSEMIAFWNSTLGLPWEYRGELPEESELEARAEPYAQWTAPEGGLIPLLTVDVQHDRLAVTCWVAGRREEMWLAFWGELYGPTVVAFAGAWLDLDQMLEQAVEHASGAQLKIAAVAIDSSDGQTSGAVYDFVRKRNRPGRPVYAVKGASDSEGKVEIWRPPASATLDPHRSGRKSDKHGVQVQIVGTARAKDSILGWAQEGGRVRLTGNGPLRMHWYQTVRPDFYEQLLSELKIPMRINPRRRQWKKRTDRANEALDCCVYAVWLVHALGLHAKKTHWWDLVESRIRQQGLFPATGDAEEATETESTPASPAPTPVAVVPPRPPLRRIRITRNPY